MALVPRKRVNINLLIPFLVFALVFGVAIWQKYRTSHELPAVPQAQPPVGKRTAVLFFVADGTRLAREARELDPCDGVGACLRDVLEELLKGPVGEFDESLPDGTVINMVRIDGDQAVIDLNRTFAEALPSGSSSEMLAVYSIVDTVATNFPHISKIKLTIDGDGKSLLRHLDLSDPLVPDYTLEQLPVPSLVETPAPGTSKIKKGQP
ncbi:MAG: GerMN domain-containing protein [Desulfuromonadales bacterium]